MFLAVIVSRGVSHFLRWGFIKWQSLEWLMSSADVSDNDCNDASDIEIVTDTVRGFLPLCPVLSQHLIITYSWLSNDWTTPDAGCIKTNLYLAPPEHNELRIQISLSGKLWPGCLISEVLCRGWKYNLCPGRYLASIMTSHLAHTGHAGAAQTQAQCCQAQGRGPHSIDSCDIFHFGILCSILSQNVYV